MMYVTVEDVKLFAHIKPSDLGYDSEDAFNAFIQKIIDYAEKMIDDYINMSFSGEPPAIVKFVTIQLCSNILHIILQRKIAPSTQANEYVIRIVSPEAFTDDLKELLNKYRKIGVHIG
ncbi:MAG: hypothetical protein QXN34_06885 [Archaeoglobaceae archaeon]